MLLAFTQLKPCNAQAGSPDQTCKIGDGMQALMSIINDTLGTPLFDTRMAALQLPMSAIIHSITDYPGESITDQIDSDRPHHQFPVWQIVLIVFAASLGTVAISLSIVVWRKKRQKQQSGRDGSASQVYCFLLAACLLDMPHMTAGSKMYKAYTCTSLQAQASCAAPRHVSVRASCCGVVISECLLPD